MPGAHAVLSPSASERWLSCPASVRLSQRLAEEGLVEKSVYAAEGTTAHSLAEIELKFAFGLINQRQYDIRFEKWLRGAELNDYDILEMRRHVADLVSLVKECCARYPHSVAMFEQRMATGIESCWGTGDVVIVSPQHVEIIDLKYGQGVTVDAEENPQLMLYGCGALDTFGDILGDTERVFMTIFQPRLEHLSTYELTADELRAWREEIRPVAAEALAGSDRFGPSEKACRWCPAAAICRARVETFTAIDFATEPDLLDNDELGELLLRAKDMRTWLDKLEDTALNKLYSLGEEISGWKVVRTNGRRSIIDDELAVKLLVEAGFTEEQVARTSPRTLGDLEKLVGKDVLPDILGDTLAKSEGKPALAHISDNRKSISPNDDAAKDFEDD